jgi:hypothetical protein
MGDKQSVLRLSQEALKASSADLVVIETLVFKRDQGIEVGLSGKPNGHRLIPDKSEGEQGKNQIRT